ncbi:hypothetical protein C8J57DRAFT_1499350 [Mycena rebaudengoi]|nr:hypothetical protein C8J57DRAFT_1499350 [Mycena rebaudengoi]
MNSGSREYDSLLLIAVAPSLRNLSIDTGGLHDAIDFPHIPLVRTFEITTFVDYPRCLPAKFQNTFAKIVIAFPDIEILNLTFRFDLVYPEIPWQTEGTSLCWVHCKVIPRWGKPYSDPIIRHLRHEMDQWMPGVPTDMMPFSLGESQPLFLQRLFIV